MSRKKRLQKHSSPKAIPVAPLPGRTKLWLFRLAGIVLIPALFFGILELALHCMGYGYSPRAIIKRRLEDKPVYCHNYQFAWRFFSPSMARHFDGFVFDTRKSPQTRRIFILGESAAAGVPAPAYNFGHILEVMLDAMYPEVNFEVLTAAMPAINSHAILEIARDCARYQPDIVIVYMGNNEIVGPYGPGTVFAPLSPNLPVIRANIALKSTRTGQLLEQLMQWAAPDPHKPKQWGGLEMFLDKQIRYDDPALDISYRHFQQNLADICRAGLDAGAAVIVSNVPTNLKDCPPFASLHALQLTDADRQTWQEIYQQGVALQTQGQFARAIEKYLEAEKIDAVYAELQFRLGDCYWNTADYQNARERYILARQYDTLRFRADDRINEILRAAAADAGQDKLYFADSIAAMDAASPHQIPGRELFYEHVHMTFKGNYILACSMLPYIQKTLSPELHPAVTDPFSEEQVAQMIAYTDYERAVCLSLVYQTFLQKPPFTSQLDHARRMADTKQDIDSRLLALSKSGLEACTRVHQQALQNRPDDWQMLFQYAAFTNSGLHNPKAEEEQLRKVLRLCPYHLAYLNLARNLHSQARIAEARSILNSLLKLNPSTVEAYLELASIHSQSGQYDQAIAHLSKALSLEPASMIGPHLSLADAYDKSGHSDKAMETLNRAITLFPEPQTAPAHAMLAYLFYTRNDFPNARKEMQTALKIDPAIRKMPSYDWLIKLLGN